MLNFKISSYNSISLLLFTQQRSYFDVQKPEKSSFFNVNLAHEAEPSNLFEAFPSFNQKLSNNYHTFDRSNIFERPLYMSSTHSNVIVEQYQQLMKHFNQQIQTSFNQFPFPSSSSPI
jgi:hypothetical protein